VVELEIPRNKPRDSDDIDIITKKEVEVEEDEEEEDEDEDEDDDEDEEDSSEDEEEKRRKQEEKDDEDDDDDDDDDDDEEESPKKKNRVDLRAEKEVVIVKKKEISPKKRADIEEFNREAGNIAGAMKALLKQSAVKDKEQERSNFLDSDDSMIKVKGKSKFDTKHDDSEIIEEEIIVDKKKKFISNASGEDTDAFIVGRNKGKKADNSFAFQTSTDEEGFKLLKSKKKC
jgi:hypothetical protein